MSENNKELLDAAKFAVRQLAKINAGNDTEDTKRLLISAQEKLYTAVINADKTYYTEDRHGRTG